MSTVGRPEEYSSTTHIFSYSPTFLYTFTYFILQISTCNPHPYTHQCCPTSSPAFSLPLPRSLGVIFTSKPLHYLPYLRAIRNGVTLSGRHGHGIITTHLLSGGPLWGPSTLMERILGAPNDPPFPLTPPYTPSRPLLLTGKLWSKTVRN